MNSNWQMPIEIGGLGRRAKTNFFREVRCRKQSTLSSKMTHYSALRRGSFKESAVLMYERDEDLPYTLSGTRAIH